MKLLFLCDVFAEENEAEIIAHAKAPVEYSANVFQKKLIAGFQAAGIPMQILSAPAVGSYPNKSDIFWFRGFSEPQEAYTYVSFCNVWGLRNYARANALKRQIREFAEAEDAEKLIVIYSVHTPFVEAAAYAKRKDPRIKVILVIPDLPQYMNLNAKVSAVYKIGKKFDIAKFNRLCKAVDGYMLLTEPMKELLPVGSKPYIVIEGITDPELLKQTADTVQREDDGKYLVYTGKLNEKFGVKTLIEEFLSLPQEDYRLVLCGRGDLDAYVQQKAKEDPRILALGQVTHDVAKAWIRRASVLVNPRPNNEAYTKYSFPSKNMEYLSSGNPVAAYMLDGMPEYYRDYIFPIKDGAMAQTLVAAAEAAAEQKNQKAEAGRQHLLQRTPEAVAKELLDLANKL